MKTIVMAIGLALSLCLGALPAGAQLEMDKPVINILRIEPNGDIDGLKARVGELREIAARLDLNVTFRLFEAWFSGPTSGQIFLHVEAPDVRSYFEAEIALNTDPQFRDVITKMGEAGQSIPFEALYSQVDP